MDFRSNRACWSNYRRARFARLRKEDRMEKEKVKSEKAKGFEYRISSRELPMSKYNFVLPCLRGDYKSVKSV